MNREQEKIEGLKVLRQHLLKSCELHEKNKWGHTLSLLEMRQRYHQAFEDIRTAGRMLDDALFGTRED